MNIVVPSLNAVLVRKSGDTMTGPLVINGGSVTTSTPILNLSQTWNDGAVLFEGLNIDVTASASLSTSRIIVAKQAGGDMFYVTRAGVGYFGGTLVLGNGTLNVGANGDVIVRREAAGILELRNGANAQTWNIYGTYTNSSEYRRLRTTMTTGGAVTIAAEGFGGGASGNLLAFSLDGTTVCNFTTSTSAFNGNVQAASTASLMCASRGRLFSPTDGQFLMANNALSDADFFLKLGVNTSAAAGIKRVGTGLKFKHIDDSDFARITHKGETITGGSVVVSTPIIDATQTWNDGAVTFTGFKLNITPTALAGGSMLMDLQTAGITRFNVSSGGTLTMGGNVIASGSLYLGSALTSILVGSAANTLDLRNSTNAQTWNVYGTYTDANNYRRLRSTMATSGTVTIAAESLVAGVAGTGNTLAFSQNGTTLLSWNTNANATIAGDLEFASSSVIKWVSRSRISGATDGQLLFQNAAQSDADFFLKFGLNTSAAAGIKRVGATIETRLNDDSAFAGAQSLYDRFGSGSPEAAISAPVGTTYHRTDGASGTSLYIKKSGTGNTGWVGTGSFLIRCGAAGTIPRTTTGCGVSSTETATNKVNYDGVDFDSSASEYANFWEYMPADYNGGTITAEFTWTAASGSGTTIFGLQARSYADGDDIDQAFGTAQTATDTLIGANKIQNSPATSAITIAGTPAAGALTCFQVYRDIADTLAVDATIIAIKITYNI